MKEGIVSRRYTRRQLLRLSGLGVAAGALAACQPKVVEVTKLVERVVKETVIVEGTAQVVERVVKETVVVESAPKSCGEDRHPVCCPAQSSNHSLCWALGLKNSYSHGLRRQATSSSEGSLVSKS